MKAKLAADQLNKSVSHADYLKLLQLSATVEKLSSSNIQRCSDLTKKRTNSIHIKPYTTLASLNR